MSKWHATVLWQAARQYYEFRNFDLIYCIWILYTNTRDSETKIQHRHLCEFVNQMTNCICDENPHARMGETHGVFYILSGITIHTFERTLLQIIAERIGFLILVNFFLNLHTYNLAFLLFFLVFDTFVVSCFFF